MFSFEPRCQGEWESQKQAGAPSDRVIVRWRAISVPWSQVIDRSSPGGRCASRVLSAWCGVSLSR